MSTQTRQVGRVSAAYLDEFCIGTSAIFVTVLYWWFKDFRLRVIGDAAGAVSKCSDIAAGPLDWLLSSQILNAAFQFPYCGFRAATGGSVTGWLVVQILLWALICILVYRTGKRLLDRTAGLVAGFSLVVLWETFRFALRPQSDLMFLFFLAVTLWTLARYQAKPTGRRRLAVFVAFVLLVTSRPFGLPIVFGFLVWDLFPTGDEETVPLVSSSVSSIVLGGVLCLVGVLAFLTLLRSIDVANATADTWRRGLSAVWSHGIVVTHTTEPTFQYAVDLRLTENTLTFLLANADHLLVMGFLKIAWFFVPVLSRWSTFHILVNAVVLTPLIAGTFAGTALALIRRRYGVIRFFVLPLLMILLTLAPTFLDGGFNYRAPATLSFALLTAYAVSVLRETYGPSGARLSVL